MAEKGIYFFDAMAAAVVSWLCLFVLPFPIVAKVMYVSFVWTSTAAIVVVVGSGAGWGYWRRGTLRRWLNWFVQSGWSAVVERGCE